MSPIASTLARLTADLPQRHPALLAFLNPGLSMEAITTHLTELPIQLADEVPLLYQWRDGMLPRGPVAVELFPGGVMMSLSEAIADYHEFMSVAPEDRPWHQEWFPLFTNRGIGGDYYVSLGTSQQAATSPILFVNCRGFDQDGYVWHQTYDSLTSLLRTVTAAWVNGLYQTDDEFYIQGTDGRRLGQLFRRYNPRTVAIDLELATGGGTAADLIDVMFDRTTDHDRPAGTAHAAARAIWALQDEPMARAVLQRLASDEPQTRALAAGLLGSMGVTEALPAIVARLQDSDATVQFAAASALGSLGDRRAVASLTALLPTSHSLLRRYILISLERLADRRAVDAILEVLATDEDPDIQCLTIKALHKIGDQRVIPTLVEISRTSTNPAVREQAIWTAGLLGGEPMEPTLGVVAAEDPDEWVRGAAARVLDHLLARREQASGSAAPPGS